MQRLNAKYNYEKDQAQSSQAGVDPLQYVWPGQPDLRSQPF